MQAALCNCSEPTAQKDMKGEKKGQWLWKRKVLLREKREQERVCGEFYYNALRTCVKLNMNNNLKTWIG